MFKKLILTFFILISLNAYADLLQPEQIVQFKNHSFACISKDQYKEAINYAARGEKTKFEAMFYNPICAPIPTNKKYKVLSRDIGIFNSYVEFTSEKSKKAEGVWTDYYDVVGQDKT